MINVEGVDGKDVAMGVVTFWGQRAKEPCGTQRVAALQTAGNPRHRTATREKRARHYLQNIATMSPRQ